MTIKVFQIGFNRCGTLSLCEFFNNNGHTAVHYNEDDGLWNDWLSKNHKKGLSVCAKYDHIVLWTDIEFVQRHFQLLAFQYPQSKFIYNIRPIDDWINSRLKFYGGGNPDQWRGEWEYRDKTIKQFFQGEHAHRLLTFDITTHNGSHIANFLPELKFSNLDFPHSHKTA